MAQRLRIALLGASGKMGQTITELAPAAGMVIALALEQASSPLAVPPGAADVLIDFSRPEATLAALPLCVAAGLPMVIGTTGLGGAEQAAITDAAQRIAIVQAANMSVGAVLAQWLAEQAARALPAPLWDAEVLEMHHRHKVDAPSGTALALGEAIARGRGQSLAQVARYAREGQVGARTSGEIGFATLRGGSVVGEHRVIFAAEGELLTIGHSAQSRSIFAQGALRAAHFAAAQAPGLYGMRAVLGLAEAAA